MPTVNMWWAHTPIDDDADGHRGGGHRFVAENHFARKDRHDLGNDAEGRQRHDVHLGMPEEPEQVLPEQRRTAGLRIENAPPVRDRTAT